MKVALIQQTHFEERQRNIEKQSQRIEEAAAAGAKLVVLAELHNSLYFCQTEDVRKFDLGEELDGESTCHFAELAKRLGVVIVISLFERRAKGIYHNTAVVLESDGSTAGTYRKMHIPDDPGFYEKFYFIPGDLGFEPIDTSVGRLGVLICWDQWYPEAARIMALKGADILIYPTAIGWDMSDTAEERRRQLEAWIAVQRGHAVANNIPVVACNRTGFEPVEQGSEEGIHFWGNSFIFGGQGELLAQAGEEETILMAEVDMQRTEDLRRIWPYFRDRRIDNYQEILKRWIDVR